MNPLIQFGLRLLAFASVVFWVMPGASQPLATERVVIEYVEPAQPAHKIRQTLLKEHGALERARDLLIHVRWPRPLKLELRECEGESNAWYEDGVITVCYEMLEDYWKAAHSPARPASIAWQDAFIGPLLDTILHEAAHALFELLHVPVLGREEDAADQLSARYLLQFPSEQKRKLIMGTAYAYASELRVRNARDLHRPRLRFGRHVTFANEHGTPAQRLYNLLCLAYGSDKELFADVVEKGYLPKNRAEMCEDEYQQIDFAYRTLIEPHVDK